MGVQSISREGTFEKKNLVLITAHLLEPCDTNAPLHVRGSFLVKAEFDIYNGFIFIVLFVHGVFTFI